jgi:hypothetical protein
VLGQGSQEGCADTTTPGAGQDSRADEGDTQVGVVRDPGAREQAVPFSEEEQPAGVLHGAHLGHAGGTLAGCDCDADLAPLFKISI